MAGVSLRNGLIVGLALVWAVVFLVARAAFAPVSEAHSSCGVPHHPGQSGFSPAYQPTTSELNATFLDASQNDLYPGVGAPWWLYNTETGDRDSRQSGTPYAPPTILKAIGWVESSWHQAHYDVARGSSGEILVSFDCGYGVMQITNALGYNMNSTSDPDGVKKKVATEYRRNLAFGTNVLIDKWNAAPQYRPIVGNGNPSLLEDWYYAIWSYNGFSSGNDPNQYPLSRGEYQCNGVNYTGFPYQERVIGCVRNAPQNLWQSIAMSYKKTLPTFTGCSGSCNTSSMDIPTPTPTHTDGGGGGGGGGDPDAPQITSRRTLDRDADGQIDAIELTFDEEVNDQFGGLKAEVKGYCDSDTATSLATCTFDGAGAANARIFVVFAEKTKGDTGGRPPSRIISNTSLADGAGNKVGGEAGRTKPADGAAPAIIKAFSVATNVLQVSFSEEVLESSVKKADFVLRMGNTQQEIASVAKVGTATKNWQIQAVGSWSDSATGQVKLSALGVVTDLSPAANTSKQTSFVPVDDGF